MTANEAAIACIGAAGLLALAGLTVSWAFDRWHKPRTTRRFQRTARQAARDTAATRRALEIAQLYEIWPDPPRGKSQIPHQTRRTEEDQ